MFIDVAGKVVTGVNFMTSFDPSTHSLTVKVTTTLSLAILINRSWGDSLVSDIALENTSFSLYDWDSRPWYRIELSPGTTFLALHPFQPLTDRSLYSKGSDLSLLLERPMFVRLQEVPARLTSHRNASNSNGSWSSTSTIIDGPLVLNLTDRNTTGQKVWVSASWLSSYGIGRPSFQLSSGENVPFERTADAFVLRPPHFSFIYVFAGDEHFRKETDFPGSEVYWDQAAQKISLRSDRTDTGDEWFSRRLPQEIDSTTGFTLSGIWSPTTQGRWQLAAPLFLASSRDVSAQQASGIYFMYASRDPDPVPPCSTCNPVYYLFYYDRTGIARINPPVFEGGRNVPYKFYTTYSASTRVLTMQIRSTADVVLKSALYTIGTNVGDDFFFGKIGAGSRGIPPYGYEAPSKGTVDNVQLTLGSVVNPSVELDANGDGVPDGWHNVWYFASRSYERSYSGGWSIKIADTDPSNGGGMETDNMPATAGRYYRAVAYALVLSGTFKLSLTFLDGNGVILGGTGIVVGTTDWYWRRIYTDGVAPLGTARVRIMAWTTNSNVGTAYFDSFYLVDSKLDNAGFEEVIGTRPTHWTNEPGGPPPTASRSHVKEGTWSLQLQDSSSASGIVIKSDVYPCIPGARYRAAVWLYVETMSAVGTGLPFSLVLVFWSQTVASYYAHGGAVGTWDYLAVEAVTTVSSCAFMQVRLVSSIEVIGTAYFDDVELLLAPPGLETDSSIWAITVQGDPATPDSIGPTSDLGVGHQRIDWVWKDMEPSQGSYDWGLIGKRRIHLRNANQVGIDVLVIVGGSLSRMTPDWVTEQNFPSEWYNFCRQVGQEFGASIYWYQLANEQNTNHGKFNSATVFNQCFAGLRSTESGSDTYDHTWFFRSIVNQYEFDLALWTLTWLPQAGSSIDVMAIDHYPGSYGNPDQWWLDFAAFSGLTSMYHKLAALMETGKEVDAFCDENCQANWILNNIRDWMRPMVFDQNANHYNSRYVLLAYYKIRDEGDQFGLMRGDGSHRPAYAVFQAEAYQYVGPPFYS